MDILTETIKTEIKRQFKTVRSFSQQIGIPQTTISSILKNGVGGTGYDTIVKICKELNVEIVNYDFPIHIDENSLKIIADKNKRATRMHNIAKNLLLFISFTEITAVTRKDNAAVKSGLL